MKDDNSTCPVCNSRTQFLYTINRYTPSFDIHLCPVCGLQMQRPLPHSPDEFYNDDYYEGRGEFTYRDERNQYPHDRYVHMARLKTIAGHIAPPARFLDVGCAFGSFVRAAGEAGYDAYGLDVSRFAVENGRKDGLKLFQGALTPEVFTIFEENSFDVITLIEVMEHIADPPHAMVLLFRLLRPGGLLVLQTADFSGRQAVKAKDNYHYYLPGHLHYYSADNLKKLLNDSGFDRFRVYRPVDFGVLPKLLKSRGTFRSLWDYMRWFRIVRYHFTGKISVGKFSMTSSMVMYARKADTP